MFIFVVVVMDIALIERNTEIITHKMAAVVQLLIFLASFLTLSSQQIHDEAWGYEYVRPQADMFWWLYGSTAPDRDSRPLIMWLQGGPGGSSTGFGNFLELGPLDLDLKPRNTTWVQAANILFVDNPVGTGYSYCESDEAFTTNVDEIATDLVAFFSGFLEEFPVFQTLPFYVFSESYGGKMAAAFGLALYNAIEAGVVRMSNFKGVALGDSWISPIDSVKTWGPYLYATSLLNEVELEKVQEVANRTQEALDEGKYAEATQLWGEAEDIIESLTDNVDFYNILLHNVPDEGSVKFGDGRGQGNPLERATRRHLMRLQHETLSELMNGPIRKKLGCIPSNVTWGGQAGEVFAKQSVDFMKDVVDTVDELLMKNITVVVYTGQLDLIVDTIGTLAWIERLKWPRLPDFMNASRIPLYPPSGVSTKNTGAFLQTLDNFSIYWIMKAGHMVPADAGEMALEMVKRIIGVE